MEYNKGYTKICQFDENLLLNPFVVSDHAEIIAQTPYGNIASWNICHPKRHRYFGLKETGSFAKTHMNPTLHYYYQFIEKKINDQLNYITGTFIQGYIAIWLIIEGYGSFYEKLKNMLHGSNYTLLYDETVSHSATNSAILINNNMFDLVKSKIYAKSYYEEFDIPNKNNQAENSKYDWLLTQPISRKKIRHLNIPVAYLKTYDKKILVVGAVHIPESNRSQPYTGLVFFEDIVNDIRDEYYDNSFAGLVLMGNFNSIPSFVEKYITAKVVSTDYPTHITVENEVTFYDMAVVFRLYVNMLPIEYTSTYTQALLESIDRSYEQYLGFH